MNLSYMLPSGMKENAHWNNQHLERKNHCFHSFIHLLFPPLQSFLALIFSKRDWCSTQRPGRLTLHKRSCIN